MSLPESLERAASELASLADQIRPANGDPHRLLEELRADDAGRVLKWVLDDEPDAAAELIDAWGEVDEGVAILLAVSDEGVAKPGRKLLRKARHRLRSQGIDVKTPDPKEAEPRRVAGVKTEADRFQAAHLSAPDFRGARMGYLVDSHPSGGARLFEVRFDPSRGILDFKIYNAGRSKIRGFLRSLTAGNAQRLFEVDREALCALVRRASLAQPSDRPLPTSFIEWRSRLFPESLEKAVTPGDLARQALGSGRSGAASEPLEIVAEEIRESRVGPWPPATSWIGEWMDKGNEAVEGLEGAPRGERIDAWLEDVSQALIEASEASLLSQHLDEMAWARWKAGAEDVARALLAVSDALLAEGSAGSTARALSRARVESLFEPFLAQLRVVESLPLEDEQAS